MEEQKVGFQQIVESLKVMNDNTKNVLAEISVDVNKSINQIGEEIANLKYNSFNRRIEF